MGCRLGCDNFVFELLNLMMLGNMYDVIRICFATGISIVELAVLRVKGLLAS